MGVAACAFATGGSGAAGCVSSYQGITSASMAYGSGAPIGKALAAGARASALAYANASIAGSIGAQSLGPVSSGVLHGIRGGVFAGIMGGDFRSGFTGGFTEGALGRFIGKQGWDADSGSGTVMAGFISGTVSEVTGGKFAVGAFSGAMGYLFRDVASKRAQAQKGRQPGTIYVTGHRVGKVGPYHTAIEYTDADGRVIVLSAGPVDGKLVSDVNRPSDAPGKNITVGTVALPRGQTAGQYVNALTASDGNYCDCIDYDLFPGIADSYNSNSYVHGLIRATGGSPSVNLNEYVGGSKPLPASRF